MRKSPALAACDCDGVAAIMRNPRTTNAKVRKGILLQHGNGGPVNGDGFGSIPSRLIPQKKSPAGRGRVVGGTGSKGNPFENDAALREFRHCDCRSGVMMKRR